MKQLFALVLILASASIASWAQVSTKSDCDRPKEIVERVWKLATEGDLLTAEGWDKMARGVFVYPAPSLGSKFTLMPPQGGQAIRVMSNDWGIVGCTTEGNTAKVVVEYYDAGSVDETLRYTPGKEPPPLGKSEMLFTLVFAPGHWETYKSDGTGLRIAEVKTTSPGWRIQSPQGPRWTTVNTAIRYVLETRDHVQYPAIKRNADLTLAKLLHFHKADNKAP
jgi:hypothetical protein